MPLFSATLRENQGTKLIALRWLKPRDWASGNSQPEGPELWVRRPAVPSDDCGYGFGRSTVTHNKMSDTAGTDKTMVVVRWVLFIPAAILGSLVVHVLVVFLNRVTMGGYIDPDSFTGGLFLLCVGNLASGFSLVYIASFLVPSHKRQVALIVASLTLVLFGSVLFGTLVVTKDYWAIPGAGIYSGGSFLAAYAIFVGAIKLSSTRPANAALNTGAPTASAGWGDPVFERVIPHQIDRYQRCFNHLLEDVDINTQTYWAQSKPYDRGRFDSDSTIMQARLDKMGHEFSDLDPAVVWIMANQYFLADPWRREKDRTTWVRTVLHRQDVDYFPTGSAVFMILQQMNA